MKIEIIILLTKINSQRRIFNKNKNNLSLFNLRKKFSLEIVSQESTNSSRVHYSIDITDDFEHYAINEYEDPVTKIYHCSVKSSMKNTSFLPDPHIMQYLDSNGLLSIRPKKHYYQVNYKNISRE